MSGVRTLEWIRCSKRARSVGKGLGVDFSLGWLSWSLVEDLSCMRRGYEVRVVWHGYLFLCSHILNYDHFVHNVVALRYPPPHKTE